MNYEKLMLTKIKNAIRRNGLKKKFIADKMGWDPAYFSRKLRGEIRLSINEMKRLTDILEIEL